MAPSQSQRTAKRPRASLVCVCSLLLSSLPAHAETERLPSGTLGANVAFVRGTGATSEPLGLGFALGFFAAWQPMRADQRFGYSLRWSTQFQYFNVIGDASAAQINDSVRLYQSELSARLRIAPTPKAGTYVTTGFGFTLIRSNEPIPPDRQRIWAGATAMLGVDHYLGGILLSGELRHGVIGSGPTTIAAIISVGYGI